MNIDATLAERGSRYGDFPGHAEITQGLKGAMQSHEGWDGLADDQKEALEMVAHKIGRIINGDPNYIDSWTDIIGYTRLVEKRLIQEQQVQHTFAFDTEQNTTFGPIGAQCQEEVTRPAANRCSVGEKLAGADQLRTIDQRASSMETMLREFFGPNVEIHSVDVRS